MGGPFALLDHTQALYFRFYGVLSRVVCVAIIFTVHSGLRQYVLLRTRVLPLIPVPRTVYQTIDRPRTHAAAIASRIR